MTHAQPATHPTLNVPPFRLRDRNAAAQMVQDLIHSAVHNGARQVHFQVSLDGLHLRVQDDGRTLDDPQQLLTALGGGLGLSSPGLNSPGLSGPGTFPAGTPRLLSMLDSTLCTRVIFASNTWSVAVTPTDVGAAQVAEVRTHASPVQGFGVLLHLTRSVDLPRLLAWYRGYTDVRVTFGTAANFHPIFDPAVNVPANAEVVAAKMFGPRVTLSTGDFSLSFTGNARDRQPGVTLWDGFDLAEEQFHVRLRQASTGLMRGLLNHAQVRSDLRTDGELRLRPDRRALQENEGLQRTVTQTLEELGVWVRAQIRAALPDPLPETLREGDLERQHQMFRDALSVYLHEQGYAQRLDLATGSEAISVAWTRLDRPWVRDQEYALAGANSLQADLPLGVNLFGPATLLPDFARQHEVSLNLEVALTESDGDDHPGLMVIALQPDLKVGELPVPFLIARDLDTESPSLILSGSPEEALGTLHRHRHLIGRLLLEALTHVGDLYNFPPVKALLSARGKDATPTADDLADLAEQALMRRHLPERENLVATAGTLTARRTALRAVKAELTRLKKTGSVSAAACSELIGEELAQVARDLKALDLRAKRLKKTTGVAVNPRKTPGKSG